MQRKRLPQIYVRTQAETGAFHTYSKFEKANISKRSDYELFPLCKWPIP